MYLAIDPGETTGWATFHMNGDLKDFGQIPCLDPTVFVLWLEKLDPRPALIIYEGWVTNPSIPQGGSKQETSQIIGHIRSYAIRSGVVAIEQPNRVKKVGYAYAGIKELPRSRHAESHQRDAIAHGVYYLVKNKIAKTALEKKLDREKRGLS